MGSDANNKSVKSEQRQGAVIVISLLALSAAFFLVYSLLQPPQTTNNTSANNANGVGADHARRVAAIKALKEAGDKLYAESDRGGLRGENEEAVAKCAAVITSPPKSEKEAATIRADLESRVRDVKKTGVIMETDAHSLKLTCALQDATRDLIKLRYGDFGDQKFRVKLDLEFQSTIPDFRPYPGLNKGSLLLELAPISLLPCSVYNFLEIARTWKHGAFHRNANHVLQAIARSNITQSMPFQEYNKQYPHKKGTMGYAGRPSGPEFYVSIQDNSRAHGPGSQQKRNPHEADVVIGTLIEGMEDGTVNRIHTMPGKEFIQDKKKWVLIRRMHILVPKGTGITNGTDGYGSDGYKEFSKSPLEIPKD